MDYCVIFLLLHPNCTFLFFWCEICLSCINKQVFLHRVWSHTTCWPARANLAKHIKFPMDKFRHFSSSGCSWVQTWVMPLFHLLPTAQHELFEIWPTVLRSPWWGLCPQYREYVEFRAWWVTPDWLHTIGEEVGGAVWAATSTHQRVFSRLPL